MNVWFKIYVFRNNRIKTKFLQRKTFINYTLYIYYYQDNGGLHLAKWKLFGKSKAKKHEDISKDQCNVEETVNNVQPEQEIVWESEDKESPLLEYKETLYSEGTAPKKSKPDQQQKKGWTRTKWDSIGTIEHNIDSLDKKDLSRGETSSPKGEVEKKVDDLIGKKHRKPSNVIYVVSRPQPGQKRGDWAVRSHGKIFSHHRKKRNAVQAARKIAKEKNATVLIQKTDGTFSRGFKPKST